MQEESPKNKESQAEKNRRTNREVFYALGLVSKLGVSVAIIAAGFVWAGIKLDQMFVNKYHIFMIMGFVLSIVVSVYDIYYLLEPIIGSEKRKTFLKRKKK
ncbi:MAG: AtpZ/AtpI family protein [Candidatus Pacebacteria bacterium]|nr:AtpZ/AtpI family protein [Candidatus Paceibacterota bacterium]